MKFLKKLLFPFLVSALLFCGCTEQQESSNVPAVSEPLQNQSIVEEDTFSYEDIYMESVDSSALSEVGYDYSHEMLAIRFRENNEHIYVYYDVPSEVYEDFISAYSLGRYYNSYIKGQYSGDKY